MPLNSSTQKEIANFYDAEAQLEHDAEAQLVHEASPQPVPEQDPLPQSQSAVIPVVLPSFIKYFCAVSFLS